MDPYDDGYCAYREGKSRDANPYRDSDERQEWDAGWKEAEAIEKFETSIE